MEFSMSNSCLRTFRRAAVAVLASAFAAGQPLASYAQSAPDYNLSSKQQTIAAPNASPVTIHVGAANKTIAPGTMLTPAELVAVNQVLNSGRQSIVLGLAGNATGGRLNITGDLGASIAGLSVPRG